MWTKLVGHDKDMLDVHDDELSKRMASLNSKVGELLQRYADVFPSEMPERLAAG